MYSQIAKNKRRSFYLLIGFLLVVIAIGYAFSLYYNSPSITLFVGVGSLIYAFVSYYNSDKIALSMSGAKEIEKRHNPRLWNMVENLSITAGLPMPKVHIINDPAPNAFATGRDPEHASVAATTGLLEMMNDSELEGVLAHELSHVGNYDIRVMGLVLAFVSVVSVLSDFLIRSMWFGGGDRDRNNNGIFMIIGIVAAVLAPIIATILKLAVSRQREYLADSSGALLTRYPEGLASALTKIGGYKRPMRRASTATAHLFLDNPLKKTENHPGGFARLFSTHPPVEERVKRLRNMGGNL